MKSVCIGCPEHGELNPPYHTIDIVFGKRVLKDVSCAFCALCNKYYSTSMILHMLPGYVHQGYPVCMGVVVNGGRETQVPAPVLVRQKDGRKAEKTPHKKKKPKAAPSPASEATFSERQVKPASMRRSEPPPFAPSILGRYDVTNESAVEASGTCPICHSVLLEGKYNMPVYQEENFYGYYIVQAYRCPRCQRAYVSKKDMDRMLARLEEDATEKKLLPKPQNVRIERVCRARSVEYLYQPVAEDKLQLFRMRQGASNSMEDAATGWRSRSFLRELGYSTKKLNAERYEILRRAVEAHGKRKVADHLRFLIRMHENQERGRTIYAVSLSVWQNDLNYIAKL